MAQPDNRGTDFYFTFLPNYHTNNALSDWDSLYIIAAAEQPATGTITLRDISGTETSVPFAITNPNTVFRIGLPWRRYELVGCNRKGMLSMGGADNQNGKAAPQSVHIVSDSEVTIYALNQAQKSSDAMMVLPADVLGNRYYVMSYPSDAQVEVDIFNMKRLTAQSTPSQLAITAVEDNTQVKITLSRQASVLNGNTAPFSITLQRGESYLLQADMYTNVLNGDMTGTLLESTKPIAVFGGHQRSVIPISATNLTSRNHLTEQMPPVPAWGKRYLLTPFPKPLNLPAGAMDIYRILAAHDNTVVSVGEKVVATLRAGQYYEARLSDVLLVEATKDILVAQFKGSSQDDQTDRLSDPFFILVPPLKQFLRSYTFAAAQINGQSPIYRQQYITILCPSDACSTVTLDGKTVDQKLFNSVPLSCYSYALVRISDGAHRIEAAKDFGLYVYGYGYADAYGYVGGMAFRTTVDSVMLAGKDTTLCRGDTASLVASGGVKYSWRGDHLSCTDCPNPLAVPEVSTLYTVEISDENGCVHERKISVRVNQPPDVVCSSDTVICTGASVQLTASGGPTIRWSPPDGLSCTECASPKATPTRTTTYITAVTNTFGCTTIDSVRVEIAPQPVVSLTKDTIVCPDSPVRLKATGGTRYEWFPSDGLSCTDCAAPTALTNDSRTYYVQVFNSTGCSTIDSVSITVRGCKSISSISGALSFAEHSLCDSAIQLCTVYNAGDLPLELLSWEMRGANASAFKATPLLPADADFPFALPARDSLQFRIVFYPDDAALLTAALAVKTSGTPEEVVCALNGKGFTSPATFELVPRIAYTEAGGILGFDVRAVQGDWSNADLQQLTLEIEYEIGWIGYSGVFARGEILDDSWQLTTREVPNANGTYRTIITAAGTTPISASGTVATVQMNVFLDRDRQFTPSLYVTPVGRENCVQVKTASQPVDVSTCARSLRPIRYTGQPLFFDIASTTESDGTIEVNYGVPFASTVNIEVYTVMGQLLYQYTTTHSEATNAHHSIDLRQYAQQLLLVRCRIADRVMSKQVLITN